MEKCFRCGVPVPDKANYCHHCGAPLTKEARKIFFEFLERRRRRAVHNILTLLVQHDCINREKLAELMKKLERIFG